FGNLISSFLCSNSLSNTLVGRSNRTSRNLQIGFDTWNFPVPPLRVSRSQVWRAEMPALRLAACVDRVRSAEGAEHSPRRRDAETGNGSAARKDAKGQTETKDGKIRC